MNTTSLVMTRLHDDLASHRREVEARLSLGQTAHEAGRVVPGRMRGDQPHPVAA